MTFVRVWDKSNYLTAKIYLLPFLSFRRLWKSTCKIPSSWHLPELNNTQISAARVTRY